MVERCPVDKTRGLRCDQTIHLRGFLSKQGYPAVLRRVRLHDAAEEQSLVFPTNHFASNGLQVAILYKARCQIEFFFKVIKRRLCIRTIVGASENAVRFHVWIAGSTYLLVPILKKTLKLEPSLHEIIQALNVTP